MYSVDIQIVSWNSMEFLPSCLSSVYNQDYPEYRVVIIDNASRDGTLEFLNDNYPGITVIPNTDNLGFSAAHNIAIRQSLSDCILVLNPDVFLSSNYVSQAISCFVDSSVGTVAGKIYSASRADFISRCFESNKKLDCTGLEILRSRRLVLRGHQSMDSMHFDQPTEVFGSDGAAPLYRRAMLEDVKIGNEYFDEDFFAYKEDHDIAWRSRLLGWKTIYMPRSIANHVRSVKPGIRLEIKDEIRRFGIRNRYLMNIKNEIFALFLRDIVPILLYEFKIALYVMLFERGSLAGYYQALMLLPRMLQKRKIVMSRRRVATQEIARWIR